MSEAFEQLGALRPDAPAAQPDAPVHVQKLDAYGRAYATGKRKDAVARVWLKPGSGRIVVNEKGGRSRPWEEPAPSDQRLENWNERRAFFLPYFLRSTTRGSRVKKPSFLRMGRSSGS